MDSAPDHPVLCSRCSRSAATPLYRTCPACREKSRLQSLHRRLLATGGGPASVSTIQFPPQSAISPQPVQRTLYSHCAQPWQSPRYKTCDRCRRWKQDQRRRARELTRNSLVYGVCHCLWRQLFCSQCISPTSENPVFARLTTKSH